MRAGLNWQKRGRTGGICRQPRNKFLARIRAKKGLESRGIGGGGPFRNWSNLKERVRKTTGQGPAHALVLDSTPGRFGRGKGERKQREEAPLNSVFGGSGREEKSQNPVWPS